MRHLLIVLVLALAVAPAVQAQQVAVPAPAEERAFRPVEVPVVPLTDELTSLRPEPVRASSNEAPRAARELSARTGLAIVGGLLIVVALISFLR